MKTEIPFVEESSFINSHRNVTISSSKVRQLSCPTTPQQIHPNQRLQVQPKIQRPLRLPKLRTNDEQKISNQSILLSKVILDPSLFFD